MGRVRRPITCPSTKEHVVVHVVVVGGGVMGSASAWSLSRRGVRVTLLEQYDEGHTRGSSHGETRIFRLAYPHRDYIDLAARSLSLWRVLEAQTSTSLLTLTGAVDHGPVQATEALHGVLHAAGRASELLDPVEAARRWPGLRFDTSVLHHPDAGRLRADLAVAAFQGAARSRGAEVHHGEAVRQVVTRTDGVTVTTSLGRHLDADALVVAAGAWTDPVTRDLHDIELPALRVTLEQPVTFPTAIDPDAWPSFIHHPGAGLSLENGIYGLAGERGVKAGGHARGREVDPEDPDRTPDPAAVAEVVDYAREWLPGADTTRPTAVGCLYTITPDHDFVVDRRGPVTVLGGFSGHGFKFAPVIGELASRLVLDGALAEPRFTLDRETTRAGSS
jgi:sarcosine oxidase